MNDLKRLYVGSIADDGPLDNFISHLQGIREKHKDKELLVETNYKTLEIVYYEPYTAYEEYVSNVITPKQYANFRELENLHRQVVEVLHSIELANKILQDCSISWTQVVYTFPKNCGPITKEMRQEKIDACSEWTTESCIFNTVGAYNCIICPYMDREDYKRLFLSGNKELASKLAEIEGSCVVKSWKQRLEEINTEYNSLTEMKKNFKGEK
jgi:hypothetical protein